VVNNLLGIYEKAISEAYSFEEKLDCAKRLGFDFMELSLDESDERLERLFYHRDQVGQMRQEIWKSGVLLLSMCFSGHRRYPLGSKDKQVRKKSLELMERAISLACDLGIRVIQLAGYDEYYQRGDSQTRRLYMEGMWEALQMAERYQVMLAVEIMDTTFMNSISKYLELKEQLPSPWFTVYPDIGNLTAWGNDVPAELKKGMGEIVAVHIKETLPVTPQSPGHFKEVPFGEGTVDFVECLHTLQQLGYGGPYLIEMWTGKSQNAEEEIRAARRFVLEKMDKAANITNNV
jgi:L-ribulose-5-phosphate 3-epimerase